MASLPTDAADTHLAQLARLIAPLPQAEAKAVIEAVKAGQDESLSEPASQEDEEDPAPPWHGKAGWHPASPHSNAAAKGGHAGGLVACAYCKQEVSLIHLSNSSHRVKRSAIHLPN
jgi:hypothetical protein